MVQPDPKNDSEFSRNYDNGFFDGMQFGEDPIEQCLFSGDADAEEYAYVCGRLDGVHTRELHGEYEDAESLAEAVLYHRGYAFGYDRGKVHGLDFEDMSFTSSVGYDEGFHAGVWDGFMFGGGFESDSPREEDSRLPTFVSDESIEFFITHGLGCRKGCEDASMKELHVAAGECVRGVHATVPVTGERISPFRGSDPKMSIRNLLIAWSSSSTENYGAFSRFVNGKGLNVWDSLSFVTFLIMHEDVILDIESEGLDDEEV